MTSDAPSVVYKLQGPGAQVMTASYTNAMKENLRIITWLFIVQFLTALCLNILFQL